MAHTKRDHQAASRKKSSLFDQIYHNYLPVTFRYAHSANYSFYHQMSSKLTKHNRIKKIGHQIHRKHYITPNNLSLDLADRWNRNNHKKDTSSRDVTTFFARVYTTSTVPRQKQCLVIWNIWQKFFKLEEAYLSHRRIGYNILGIICEPMLRTISENDQGNCFTVLSRFKPHFVATKPIVAEINQ